MAYKRKRTYRRNSRRTKRRIFRARRSLGSNNTHMFKRVADLGTLTMGGTGITLKALSFNFAQLPDHSEFLAIYDMYRINKIKVTLVPNWTQMDAGFVPTSGNWAFNNSQFFGQGMPNVHSVIDYDNVGMAGYDVTDLMQYTTYKRTRGHQEHTRYFTPAIQMGSQVAVNSGTASTATVQKFKPWLDFQTDVPHYGVKLIVDEFSHIYANGTDVPNPNLFYRIYATFYFQCKGVR